MIIWLIGLSGAGKTEIGKRLFRRLREERGNVVFIDGDLVRYIMGNDLGHTLEDRRRNADRICRLCKTLDEQGLHVVCSILSLFPESRKWNRENYSSYFEVYIEVDREVLRRRDNKDIYRRADAGELKNVAGVDLRFPVPENPDLVLDNNDDLPDLDSKALEIYNALPPLLDPELKL